eukprot:1159559-Pelagomonas_calceolata.AAC.5
MLPRAAPGSGWPARVWPDWLRSRKRTITIIIIGSIEAKNLDMSNSGHRVVHTHPSIMITYASWDTRWNSPLGAHHFGEHLLHAT